MKQQNNPTVQPRKRGRPRQPFVYQPGKRLMSRRALARGLEDEIKFGSSVSKLYASLLLRELAAIDPKVNLG